MSLEREPKEYKYQQITLFSNYFPEWALRNYSDWKISRGLCILNSTRPDISLEISNRPEELIRTDSAVIPFSGVSDFPEIAGLLPEGVEGDICKIQTGAGIEKTAFGSDNFNSAFLYRSVSLLKNGVKTHEYLVEIKAEIPQLGCLSFNLSKPEKCVTAHLNGTDRMQSTDEHPSFIQCELSQSCCRYHIGGNFAGEKFFKTNDVILADNFRESDLGRTRMTVNRIVGERLGIRITDFNPEFIPKYIDSIYRQVVNILHYPENTALYTGPQLHSCPEYRPYQE